MSQLDKDKLQLIFKTRAERARLNPVWIFLCSYSRGNFTFTAVP